jgi:hypothetical protein
MEQLGGRDHVLAVQRELISFTGRAHCVCLSAVLYLFPLCPTPGIEMSDEERDCLLARDARPYPAPAAAAFMFLSHDYQSSNRGGE